MKTVILLLVSQTMAPVEEAQRPVCNAQTVGQFWPAEANQSREAVRKAAQEGDLQVCLFGRWKYKWATIAVNVRDLASAKRKPASEAVSGTNQ